MQAQGPTLVRFSPGSRPHGSEGMPVKVYANAFPITRLPTLAFIHFDIVIEPQVNDLRRAQMIMSKLQTELRPDLFRKRGVYDGRKNFYVQQGTGITQHASASFDVTLSTHPTPHPTGKGVHSVKFTRVGEINPQLLGSVIAGNAPPAVVATAVNLLQSLVRQAPIATLNATFNARSVFSSQVANDIGGGFELWRGYFQSVRPSPRQMIVNVDVSTAAIYKAQPVIGWCLDYLSATADTRNDRGRVDLKYLMDMTPADQAWKQLKAALRNVRVIVKVPAGSNRTRPIKDFVPRAGTFEFKRDDTITTIQEHYRTRNNHSLRFPGLFGICVNVERQIIIPAEVCDIAPGQMYKKTLPQSLMAKVLAFSSKAPNQRFADISVGVGGPLLNYAGSDYVSQVGMEISRKPVNMTGRILTAPAVRFSGDYPVRMQQQGVWNVVGQSFYQPAPPSVWAVVSLVSPSKMDQQRVAQVVGAQQRSCVKLGMSVQYAGQVRLGMGSGDVERVLEEACREVNASLVIVILPNFAAPQRKTVKAWGDSKRRVATQCLKLEKLDRANDQYYNNVALKINVKLGGVNSIINEGILNTLRQEPIMIIGADVSHPGPGIKDRPSVTSLVASYDNSFSRYAAFARVQQPRAEMILDLKEMMEAALDNFYKKNNNVPPKRLVFFRDGISEGEFETVARQEIIALRQAWDDFCRKHGAPRPVPFILTYIVVGKRHHIRFFTDEPGNRDNKSGNVKAGLVVDTEVVSPASWDFYLQAHSGLKGTSRPGHYIVLFNNNNYDANQLQALSHHLCYVYARATRSVSIPAPVYYADLVCGRAGLYFKDDLGYSDVASDSHDAFDLNRWREGFASPGPEKMFFM